MATIGNMMPPGMTGATNPNDPALTGPANPTAGLGNTQNNGVDEELQMLGLEGGPMAQYAMISGLMQQTQQQMAQMNSMFAQNQEAINGSMGVGAGAGVGGGMGAGGLGGGGGANALGGGGGLAGLTGGGGLPGANGVGAPGNMQVAQGLGNYLGPGIAA